MELRYNQFQKVIDDLEGKGATVRVLADVAEDKETDYTIEAYFPNGKVWEIIEIQ